ncbi:MAG: hypothetical protein IKV87_00445 [Methanobrevibacter sp.]|nr:hypothetical protein [Methanobrevibacter sp.]
MIRKLTIVSFVLIMFLAVSAVSANDADLSSYCDHPDTFDMNLPISGSGSFSQSSINSGFESSDEYLLTDSLNSASVAVSRNSSSEEGSLNGSDDSNLGENKENDYSAGENDLSQDKPNTVENDLSQDKLNIVENDLSLDNSTENNVSDKVQESTIIGANPISFNYASPKGLTIKLTDSNGLALSNKTISVFVNGIITNLTTDSKGFAVFKYTSSVGSYNVLIRFYGDDGYAPSNASTKITIKKSSSKLKLSKITAYMTLAKYVSTTLLDSAGNPIKNKPVTIQVKKTKYTAKTDAKGIAKIKVSNKLGTYVVKVKFAGDKNHYSSSNSSKLVISKMKVKINAPSVKSYMTNNTYLTIKLTNIKGSALANKKVYVRIAKKTHVLRTNSKGVAKLKFAKKTGTYNCKISFKATGNYYAASLKSKVVISKMPTSIKAPSVSVNSTTYGKVLISLKDHFGKALKNAAVSVNVTGLNRVYTLKTNASGIATFKFNGEKSYNLKIRYLGNKNYAASSVNSKLNIKPINVKLNDIIASSEILSAYVSENKSLPSYIEYESHKFTVPELSYLMAKAVKNIDNKNYNDIVLISVSKSYKSSGEIYDTIYRKDYVSIAKKVVLSSYNYYNKEYVKHSIYKVPFKVYTANFARILTYYGNNKRLPNYSLFTCADFVKVSNSSKYTFYLTTDNIAGKRSDLNMLKRLAKTLKNKGYNAVIVGIGPDIHNVAYRYGCTGKNSVLLACFGGVDVGCIEEWTGDIGELNGHHFVDSYDGAHVLGLWFTRPYGASVSLYKKVGIAWDANYGFPLSNPAKYMSSHNISYIQASTVADACNLLSQGKMGGPKLIK